MENLQCTHCLPRHSQPVSSQWLYSPVPVITRNVIGANTDILEQYQDVAFLNPGKCLLTAKETNIAQDVIGLLHSIYFCILKPMQCMGLVLWGRKSRLS